MSKEDVSGKTERDSGIGEGRREHRLLSDKAGDRQGPAGVLLLDARTPATATGFRMP